ncbi:hypothetical protein DF044_14780 [Burkholderia contaminans]|nr:hypothetical protein DF044_14780 [Burkholderia contaminans]
MGFVRPLRVPHFREKLPADDIATSGAHGPQRSAKPGDACRAVHPAAAPVAHAIRRLRLSSALPCLAKAVRIDAEPAPLFTHRTPAHLF